MKASNIYTIYSLCDNCYTHIQKCIFYFPMSDLQKDNMVKIGICWQLVSSCLCILAVKSGSKMWVAKTMGKKRFFFKLLSFLILIKQHQHTWRAIYRYGICAQKSSHISPYLCCAVKIWPQSKARVCARVLLWSEMSN